MDKYINLAQQARLDKMHSEIFDMANSYAGDKYGYIAIQLHLIANQILEVSSDMENEKDLN